MKNFTLIPLLFCISIVAYSQGSSLIISDLRNVISKVDSMENHQLTFHINNPDSVDVIFIMFGSEKDQGDIKSLTGKATYFSKSKKNAFVFNDWHYPAVIRPDITFNELIDPNSRGSLKFVSIYLYDKRSVRSNSVYYQYP